MLIGKTIRVMKFLKYRKVYIMKRDDSVDEGKSPIYIFTNCYSRVAWETFCLENLEGITEYFLHTYDEVINDVSKLSGIVNKSIVILGKIFVNSSGFWFIVSVLIMSIL